MVWEVSVFYVGRGEFLGLKDRLQLTILSHLVAILTFFCHRAHRLELRHSGGAPHGRGASREA
jgi:hypothetical protein